MVHKFHDLCKEFRNGEYDTELMISSSFASFSFFPHKNEKMVEQQMVIDQLKETLEKFADVKTLAFSNACEDGPAVAESARRPYSVPLTKSLLHPLHPPLGTETRKVRSIQM